MNANSLSIEITKLQHTHMFTLLLALFFNIQAGKSPVSILSVRYLIVLQIEMRLH
jgi:hypothetical protein